MVRRAGVPRALVRIVGWSLFNHPGRLGALPGDEQVAESQFRQALRGRGETLNPRWLQSAAHPLDALRRDTVNTPWCRDRLEATISP